MLAICDSPPSDAQMIDLPTPSGYRQTVPAFPNTEPGAETQRADRKRRFIWFGVAAALHAALLLALFLTPPLRLKAGYAPDRWVQIVSVPLKEPDPPVPAPAPATVAKPTTAKVKAHRTKAAAPATQPAPAE
jgi:hypothetical protein